MPFIHRFVKLTLIFIPFFLFFVEVVTCFKFFLYPNYTCLAFFFLQELLLPFT